MWKRTGHIISGVKQRFVDEEPSVMGLCRAGCTVHTSGSPYVTGQAALGGALHSAGL